MVTDPPRFNILRNK